MEPVITVAKLPIGLEIFLKRGIDRVEHFFTCPYCWERISMILDYDEESAEYIEDCEVCCRPIELTFKFIGERLVTFNAKRMDGI